MNNITREEALKLEINRLRDDIQSSDVIQTKPYINGKVNVSNPKWHLQTHLNEIERLINLPFTTQLSDEIKQLIKNNDFSEYCEDWNSKLKHTSSNDIIDTLGKEYIKLLEKNKKQASEIERLKDFIKQALTKPSLEELKQSIIDRLNECEHYDNNMIWDYNSKENFFYCYINDSDSKGYIYALYEGYYAQLDNTPLDLAHDITTYFMRLRSEKDDK